MKATRKTSKTETFVIFSHDPEGVRSRLSRYGAVRASSVTIEREGDRDQVIAVCRANTKVCEEADRLRNRGFHLRRIGYAIQAGTAYLETAWGRRKVVGYNDRTGDAVTRNDGEADYNQRTFLVCIDTIKTD